MRINRPRHRKHRRHSRRLSAFLTAQATRWLDAEARANVTAVDDVNDDVTVTGTLAPVIGPVNFKKVPIPEVRTLALLFAVEDGSDNTTLYTSRHDAAQGRSKILLAPYVMSFTFVDADVNVGNNTIAEVGHLLETGYGPVTLTNAAGALPAGLSAGTSYWVIKVDADLFKLATSRVLALAGTAVDITAAAGGGTHTLNRTPTIGADLTARGLQEWMARGVKRETIRLGALVDPSIYFK